MTSRYKRIYTQVWGDAKFTSLSKPQPCAQYLWFYLMTGPHCGAAPGIFRATIEGIAAELGWPAAETAVAFEELEAAGMVEIDRKVHVVAAPRAPWYDPPTAPNVLITWSRELDNLPECELVEQHSQRIVEAIAEVAPGLLDRATALLCQKSTRKGCDKTRAIPKPIPKVIPSPIPDPFPFPFPKEDQEGSTEPGFADSAQVTLSLVAPLTPRQTEAMEALGDVSLKVSGWSKPEGTVLEILGEGITTALARDLEATPIRLWQFGRRSPRWLLGVVQIRPRQKQFVGCAVF